MDRLAALLSYGVGVGGSFTCIVVFLMLRQSSRTALSDYVMVVLVFGMCLIAIVQGYQLSHPADKFGRR